MYQITKLYDALSKYNSFVVNGRICTNGCKPALISTRPARKTDTITFKYGNFNFLDLSGGEYVESYMVENDKFTILWKGGQVSVINAYNAELPQAINMEGTEVDRLADVRLVDERNSFVFSDGTVCLALDLDRLAGLNYHKLLLSKFSLVQDMGFAVGRDTQMLRIEPVIKVNDGTLTLMDIDRQAIKANSISIDINGIRGYVDNLLEKCNRIYGKPTIF